MRKYTVPVVSNTNRKRAKLIGEQTKVLEDGRPVKIQIWAENGFAFITYFFLVEGMEKKSKEELFNYLQQSGLIVNQGYSKGKVVLQKFYDANKQICWGLTISTGKKQD